MSNYQYPLPNSASNPSPGYLIQNDSIQQETVLELGAPPAPVSKNIDSPINQDDGWVDNLTPLLKEIRSMS